MVSTARLTLSALLIALATTACNRERVVYSQFHDIPGGTWTYSDSYEFNFIVDDVSSSYRLLLDVSHSEDYNWQNLYTQIETTFPLSDTALTDIVSLELANKAGVWYGDCSRSTCAVTIPLQDPVSFEQPGEYSLVFSQHMRQDSVKGVRRIGLRLVQPPADKE